MTMAEKEQQLETIIKAADDAWFQVENDYENRDRAIHLFRGAGITPPHQHQAAVSHRAKQEEASLLSSITRVIAKSPIKCLQEQENNNNESVSLVRVRQVS